MDIPFTGDRPAFVRQVRNHLLTLVTALARGDADTALGLVATHDSDGRPWSTERLGAALQRFWEARGPIRLDPEARNARHTHLAPLPQSLPSHLSVEQMLIDSDGLNDWSVRLTLDVEKSNIQRSPVLALEDIAPRL
jgi:hypothetical protein